MRVMAKYSCWVVLEMERVGFGSVRDARVGESEPRLGLVLVVVRFSLLTTEVSGLFSERCYSGFNFLLGLGWGVVSLSFC